jgi:hypothetical protein
MRTTWIGCAVVLASALLIPEAARAQRLEPCELEAPAVRRGGWLLDVSYRPQAAPPPRAANNLKQMTIAMHYMLEGDQVLVFFLGGATIKDGTSNTFLVGEAPPSLACDDGNGDGFAGISRMTFDVRDVRTGELVQASLAPHDGELDHDEIEEATIVIGRVTVVAPVRTRYWVFGTELPR